MEHRHNRGLLDAEQLAGSEPLSRFSVAAAQAVAAPEHHNALLSLLGQLTAQINAGASLDQVLHLLFCELRATIPYDRVGVALLEDEGRVLRARWVRTLMPHMRLNLGYSAPLAGSSLAQIIETGHSRIISDLVAYLEAKPSSRSTRLIVAEGLRASLTCPLIAAGTPIGVIFFASAQVAAYNESHIACFEQIAGNIAVLVEKSRLVGQIQTQRAELEQLRSEQIANHRSHHALLEVLAQQLRTPISIVQVNSAILTNPALERSEAERAELLEEINRQSSQALLLLTNLLELQAIEAGLIAIETSDLNLATALRDAVERHEAHAKRKGIRLRLRLSEQNNHALVRADPARLGQILDHLLRNAITFAPHASTVEISASRHGRSWRCLISDEGPGISDDERPRLFTPFARLSACPTGGEKRAGLGLAITRHLIELHHGAIGAESSPNRGTAFWFTLPASW